MKPNKENYKLEIEDSIIYAMENCVVVVAPNRTQGLKALEKEMGEGWLTKIQRGLEEFDMYYIIAPDSNFSELSQGFLNLLNESEILFPKGTYKDEQRWDEIWKNTPFEKAPEFK